MHSRRYSIYFSSNALYVPYSLSILSFLFSLRYRNIAIGTPNIVAKFAAIDVISLIGIFFGPNDLGGRPRRKVAPVRRQRATLPFSSLIREAAGLVNGNSGGQSNFLGVGAAPFFRLPPWPAAASGAPPPAPRRAGRCNRGAPVPRRCRPG